MTKDRYDSLKVDAAVYKSNHQLEYQCLSACKRYNIGVYYNPPGLIHSDSEALHNKAFLGVYPSPLKFNPLLQILKEELLFLMNSSNLISAFTFRLTMDCARGEAFLKVLDFPEVNDDYFSEREIHGISKAINPDHIQYLPKL